jgi:hypothetical protein
MVFSMATMIGDGCWPSCSKLPDLLDCCRSALPLIFACWLSSRDLRANGLADESLSYGGALSSRSFGFFVKREDVHRVPRGACARALRLPSQSNRQ